MVSIPFYKPSIGEEEINEVINCLRSGWLTTGPRVKEFEAAFSRYLRHRHGVAVNSCTAALHLALEAVGLKAGQAVLVPTLTFAATAEVVRYFNAVPLLVDCRSEDLNLDVEDAERQIQDAIARGLDVVAIIVMHYGGQIGDVDGITRLARRYHLKVIEDAAHCCPAYYRDNEAAAWQTVGSIGEISCYSFYANKPISTGEGGMACTDSDEHAGRMRLMSLHGISRDAWNRYAAEGSWFYEIIAPGYKYNLTDIAAAIGVHQIRKADQMHQRRSQLAQLYSELLSDMDEVVLPRALPNRIHSWHLYSIRLRTGSCGVDRCGVIEELKSGGIGTSVHWTPLHLHPYYRETFGYDSDSCSCATSIYPELMSLPLYPDLTSEHVEHVCGTLKQIIVRSRSTINGVTIKPAQEAAESEPSSLISSPASVTENAADEEGDTSDEIAGVATAKRIYDASLAGLGLFLLSPVFLLIAFVQKLTNRGNIFYSQTRIGQNAIPFRIWKFRTMVPQADKVGPCVTSDGDRRITGLGRILRKTKLDELPQLWNVLRGDMSLVGPRPEVPDYIAHYTPEQRGILQYKPGITDLASLRFRNEESLLANSENPERFYVEQCLPRKIKLNQEYVLRANILTDTWIILQTVCPYWIGVLAVYGMILASSFWFSCWLVSDLSMSGSVWSHFLREAPLAVALQLACLLARRQCKGLLCYFGIPELRQVGIGLGLACLLLLCLSFIHNAASPPRNLILINFFISFLFVCGFRLLLRLWREWVEGGEVVASGPPMRVGIIGAGSLGAQLARSLNGQKNFGRVAVAFFDDDSEKWQKQIHEVPVIGMPECLLHGWREKLDEVAIASPNVSPARLQEIEGLFESIKVRVYRVQWSAAAWLGLDPVGASNSGYAKS
jgi:dTDP-4-amino-4,6-dideoxygalactose transaminase/lipopolysaccharide/colanic/teichoic acid biosynthesis glycosyltransferase